MWMRLSKEYYVKACLAQKSVSQKNVSMSRVSLRTVITYSEKVPNAGQSPITERHPT